MQLARRRSATTTDLQIEEVPIGQVILWKDNPRKNDTAVPRLAEVIKTRGQVTPVVVWRKNGVCYKGNTTVKALKFIGSPVVKVLYADFPSEQAAIAYGIADNKSSEWAQWDDELLRKFMEVETIRADSGFSVRQQDQFFFNETSAADQSVLYTHEELIEQGFVDFRKHGFPFKHLSKFECMQQLNILALLPLRSCLNSSYGSNILDTYFPHRFKDSTYKNPSAYESFFVDKRLRHAINMHIKEGGYLPLSHFGMLNIVHGTQNCSNFRPAFAKLIYNTYGGKGKILDMSHGYGGRLLGFMASNCRAYVGVDPYPASHEAADRMVHDLARGKEIKLIQKPFEDCGPESLGKDFDLAFTSPPYFNKENYGDNPIQSSMKYKGYEAWRDKFLAKVVGTACGVLKRGAMCIINIADVDGLPLVDDTRQLAKRAGFSLVKEEKYFLSARMTQKEKADYSTWEPVLFFQKP